MLDLVSLKVKCPICHTSLMDGEYLVDNQPSVKMKIHVNNQKEIIWLSSIYGSYNFHSDIEVPEDEIGIFECFLA